MVHLLVHLADEATLAGPVQYRWMYPIERYLQTLKRFVRNNGRPKGSIVEAYLVDECLSFYSMYLRDVKARHTCRGRNEDGIGCGVSGGLSSFYSKGCYMGSGEKVELDLNVLDQCHRYILNNCDEVNPFRRQHEEFLKTKHRRERLTIRQIKELKSKCGVFVPANVPGAIGQVNCYGRVVDMFEVKYCGHTESTWNENRSIWIYVEDTIEKDWHLAVRTQPRDLFDVMEDSGAVDDYAIPNLDDQILDNENFLTRVGVEDTPFHESLSLPTKFINYVNTNNDLTNDDLE
ncbi:unnamed protein product [Malus baccata var. baccata]